MAGTLEDAVKIIKPGRTFLRRIYNTIATLDKQHHHTRINEQLHSDIGWWHTFLSTWNGVSMLSTFGQTPDTAMASDASGSWDCGSTWEGQWFQLAWSKFQGYDKESIATKELLPIVIAAAIWGPYWHGRVVKCKCDNQAVVAVLATRTARDQNLMHLLRCLFFFEASFQFTLIATYIAGSTNHLADDLSRDKLPSFLQKMGSQAAATPTAIPPLLTEMLITKRPDWLSHSWRQMFRDTLNKV